MTKAEIVSVRSLHDKRGRMASGFFVAEGRKAVEDLVNSALRVVKIYCLEEYLESLRAIVSDRSLATQGGGAANIDVEAISPKEMERISLLKSPSEVVALIEIPRHDIDVSALCRGLSLVLDSVQDPGNLGTIIRLADWFGIQNVICSPDSADCFNPKVVQATMGAIARVKVHYLPLVPFLERICKENVECHAAVNTVPVSLSGSAPGSVSDLDSTAHHTRPTSQSDAQASVMNLPIYGTFLDGDIIYDSELSPCGIIVMGSEGRGISPEVEPFITHRLFIPPFPVGVPTSESLNVAVATSIVCSEFRRGSK